MPNTNFPVSDNIKTMAPYKAGKPIDELAREMHLDPKGIVKVASNENPFGFSEKVRQALIEFLQNHELEFLGRYPDANCFDLKQVLAKHYQVSTECLTLGNGSNDLLELISLTFLNQLKSCVYSEHAFVVYALSTQARAAKHIKVPMRGLSVDLDAMFDAIQDDTAVVYVANPNNPTGSFVTGQAIRAFVERVYNKFGRRVLVVLDEAYNEYLDPGLRFDSAELVRQFENLIVLRTFSKAYGLAGLRVGYAIAHPEVTDYLNRVRQPFNVNMLAQVAAIAALDDKEFLQQTYQANQQGKIYLSKALTEMGLEYEPSFSNFILVKIGVRAAAVFQALLAKGIIVRYVAGDGLPEYLRISIGLPQENEICINALREVLHT